MKENRKNLKEKYSISIYKTNKIKWCFRFNFLILIF